MSTTTEADIHAFGPAPAVAAARAGGAPTHPAAAAPPLRRRWPWVVLALAVLFVAAVVAGVLVLGEALEQVLGGLDIRVDDRHLLTLPKSEAAWWVLLAALLAAIVMLVVVPLALLMALLVTALALVAAVLVTLAVAALAFSPVWVLALLLWLALRAPRASFLGVRPQA